jgi:regulator of sirC expression with transglutaminase-like and TPR domain
MRFERRRRLKEAFAVHVAAGERCDVARGALTIARIAYPDLDPEPSLAALDALADAAQRRLAAAPTTPATETLTRVVFEDHGFRGNTDDYYDPRNSFLNDVLVRRTGIPISLAVVLMETAGRLGLPLEGVGFPGHFLVRAPGAEGPLLLDPFYGGRPISHGEMLDRLRAFYASGAGHDGTNLQRVLPGALQTIGPLGILSRMLGNLLHIWLEREQHEEALDAVELMLLLDPSAAEPTRIRALLYEQLECFASALRDCERYLELAPTGPHATQMREHLMRLQGVTTTLH